MTNLSAAVALGKLLANADQGAQQGGPSADIIPYCFHLCYLYTGG